MKKTFTILLIMIICGCVTQKIDDTQTLKQDEGVLVVGLDTNWEGHKNILLAPLELIYTGKGSSSFGYKKLKFKGENHILVTTLPSKEYYFYQFSFGNRYASLKEHSRFEIKPGKVTYIGDISMQLDLKLFSAKGELEINDNWEATLDYLRENYPKIIENRDFEKSIIKMELK